MFATSLIGVTANQNTYFQGLYYASSTAATAMSNLIPALTFVIAAIFGFEKVDLRSLRFMAKILGTVCCVVGALTMALLKGHKLLNTEFIPFIHLTASRGDDWLLGCSLLLASSVFWSSWIIMQVNKTRTLDCLCIGFSCEFGSETHSLVHPSINYIFTLHVEFTMHYLSAKINLQMNCCNL